MGNRKGYLVPKSSPSQARGLQIQAYISELKERTPCADCGQKYAAHQMDFDHRDFETKKYAIASIHNLRSWKITLEEIEKCDIVCANCHRKRTHVTRCQSESWGYRAKEKSTQLELF